MHKTDQFSLDFQYFSIDIFSLDVRLWDHKCIAKSQDMSLIILHSVYACITGLPVCYDQRNCILHLKEGQQRGSRIITSACLYVRSKLSICISKSHWARKYQPCITRVLRIICGNNILASGRWIHGCLSPLLSYFSFTVVVSFICGGLESNREP